MPFLSTRLRVCLLGLTGLLAVSLTAPVVAQPVDLELVLAVDASSSVNAEEFQLQMQGIAAAFRHPAVVKAIDAAGSAGVAVTLVQWSGSGISAQAVDWTLLSSALSSYAFAARIEAAPRLVEGGATAIGSALLYAGALLDANAYEGKRRIIDLSGDGISNEGDYASTARAHLVRQGVTVNGLAILNDEPNLGRYYLAGVVGGPGAFVLTALDFRDFAVAIRQKLVTEITGGTISLQDPVLRPTFAAKAR